MEEERLKKFREEENRLKKIKEEEDRLNKIKEEEEKRIKLLRLGNSVSELIKQQKDQIAPGEDLDV